VDAQKVWGEWQKNGGKPQSPVNLIYTKTIERGDLGRSSSAREQCCSDGRGPLIECAFCLSETEVDSL